MQKVQLRKRIGDRVAKGHPWIYNNEIQQIDEGIQNGDIVEVIDHDEKFIGKGFFNALSQIQVRLGIL
jgi:SAM-dependent methyltransferase (EC 2.1.1.-)